MLGRRMSMQLFKPASPEVPQTIEKATVIVKPESPVSIKNLTIAEKPESPEPMENMTIVEESEIEEADLIVKPARKNIVCSLFANDSFEENETMLANCSANETILASTLLMTAKKEDSTIEQVLKSIFLLLKKNSDAIENNIQEREILKEMKRHVLEKR